MTQSSGSQVAYAGAERQGISSILTLAGFSVKAVALKKELVFKYPAGPW